VMISRRALLDLRKAGPSARLDPRKGWTFCKAGPA
jgi:hypothetical protein